MTNVNRKLATATKTKLEGQFSKFLSSLSADQAQNFFDSFFTESEQIMFMKRLAAVMMLEKSIPHRHIAEVLHITPTTVGRINKRRQHGAYDNFTDLFATEKRKSRIWKALEIAIEEGGTSLQRSELGVVRSHR